MKKISYSGYGVPPEIIQQAIWLNLGDEHVACDSGVRKYRVGRLAARVQQRDAAPQHNVSR